MTSRPRNLTAPHGWDYEEFGDEVFTPLPMPATVTAEMLRVHFGGALYSLSTDM